MARRAAIPGRKNPIIEFIELDRSRVPSFERYPFNIPAIRSLERLTLHPDVTFFVGENGSGKSTLLEAIAVRGGANPEGGSKNFKFGTRTSHSELDRCLRTNEDSEEHRTDCFFLRAESSFNVATEIEKLDRIAGGGRRIIDSYGGKSLHEQSHGESFLALITNRFKGGGLYILDEPEAALSPNRQLSLLSLIHQLCRRGSQFIIATHSPIVLGYPSATIYRFSDEGLNTVAYEDCEQYRITRAFLDHREKMLAELLRED